MAMTVVHQTNLVSGPSARGIKKKGINHSGQGKQDKDAMDIASPYYYSKKSRIPLPLHGENSIICEEPEVTVGNCVAIIAIDNCNSVGFFVWERQVLAEIDENQYQHQHHGAKGIHVVSKVIKNKFKMTVKRPSTASTTIVSMTQHNPLNTKSPALKKTKTVVKKKARVFAVPTPHRLLRDDHQPMEIDIAPNKKIRQVMVRIPEAVEDIDDHNDPFKCPLYAQDIYEYLMSVERKWVFPAEYLNNNPRVPSHARAILVDWLIDVQVHQKLSNQTLHITAALIDRFLCMCPGIDLSLLQLVGITCLLIAAKFVERFPPEIAELCFLTNHTYVPNQVLEMERWILKTLSFDLNIPDPTIYLDRFLQIHESQHTDEVCIC
ncbi:hypothetical protein CHS0354_029372 [Potamilus streckersoni]|uniref:Cyclin-like domain-containing protein n=1 Tax=Potamilus streckersoni TaxID=2493646 RepID=A0AAE0W2A0_9BIVA|nr:hypothetical protein CHS0354_029372 [Potamilus streckersoni]